MLFSFFAGPFLVEADTFEGVVVTGSAMTELGSEGIVETFDGFGQGCCLRLVAVLLFEVLAVVDGILIAAGEDVGSGVVFVVRVFLQDGIDVEDEVADTLDGELAAFRREEFGFLDGEGFHDVDLCLDGFLLCTEVVQGC